MYNLICMTLIIVYVMVLSDILYDTLQEENLQTVFKKQLEEDRKIVISRSNLNELRKVILSKYMHV